VIQLLATLTLAVIVVAVVAIVAGAIVARRFDRLTERDDGERM